MFVVGPGLAGSETFTLGETAIQNVLDGLDEYWVKMEEVTSTTEGDNQGENEAGTEEILDRIVLSGTIKDNLNELVIGAEIAVFDSNNELLGTTTSDSSGEWIIMVDVNDTYIVIGRLEDQVWVLDALNS